MRITDLLDVRSVSLDAAPKSKQKAIDAAVALMVKSGKTVSYTHLTLPTNSRV